MKYKVVIKNGSLSSIFKGEEIDIKEIKSFSFIGKTDEHAKIVFNNGEETSLTKEEVEIKHE